MEAGQASSAIFSTQRSRCLLRVGGTLLVLLSDTGLAGSTPVIASMQPHSNASRLKQLQGSGLPAETLTRPLYCTGFGNGERTLQGRGPHSVWARWVSRAGAGPL